MTGGLYEVNAGMNSVIDYVHAVDPVFGLEIGVKPLLDVFDNGSPRVIIVHEIAEARSIHYSEA